MKPRRIGPFHVSAIGLGCMNLSHASGAPPSFEAASALLHRALDLGCTPAQLALAWLLARGAHIVPIPGTTRIDHLEENVAADEVVLTPAQMLRLDALVNRRTVHGARDNAANQGEVDTEEFDTEAFE